MGFWSRFEKKETTHFERDSKTGKVTETYRNGRYEEPQPKFKPVRQLEQEYYTQKKKERMQRPPRFSPLNRIDVVPVPYRSQSRSTSFKPYRPSKRDRNPFSSMFDLGLPNAPRMKQPKTTYVAIKGKAYPLASSTSKKKKKKDNLLGFDMLGNNWGL